MRPSARRWMRQAGLWGLAVVGLAALPGIEAAEPSVDQLPKDVASFSLAWVALPQAMVEVTRNHGPLAGASWGVVKGSSDVIARVADLAEVDASFEGETPRAERPTAAAYSQDNQFAAWLDQQEIGARDTRRQPALLRYAF